MLLNSIRSHSSLLLCISVLVTSAYGDCGPPPVKPKTLPIEGTSFKTGTTVDYSCNNNLGYYDIPGMSRTITCLDIDQWSDVLEFCQRACGPPPILKEATLRPEYISNNYFIENATVQYECRFGFVPITDRKNTLTCLTNLTWSTLEEFCKRRSCPSLSNIENGYFEAKDFLFGTRASYYCNKGYRMIPATHSRSCKSDGTWSNGEPVCNGVICAKPDSIPNGSYTPVKDEYRYPDPVTYSCNENFTFIGTSNISCGSDGTWSPEAPKCIVTCSEPNVPNSKRFPGSVSLFTLKSEVLFQCNEGFFMKGSNLASCNIDSQWEPPLPECLRACGPIPRLPEAELKPKYVDKNLTENATVQYECRPGYNRIPGSNNSIICLSNFSWSTPGQFCTRRSCPSLSEIENGYFEAKDFLFGTRATYYCNKGYMIARRNYRECTADGTWSNEDPVCEAVICPMPVSIPYRAYMPVKNKYSYQENVTYICSKDWTLLGTSTISCGSDGNWSSEAPECIERRHNIAAIVVPIVTILVIFIIIMMIVLFLLKKKSGVYHCGSPIGDGKSQYKSSETCPQTTNEYQNFSMNSPPYSRKMSGTTNGQ